MQPNFMNQACVIKKPLAVLYGHFNDITAIKISQELAIIVSAEEVTHSPTPDIKSPPSSAFLTLRPCQQQAICPFDLHTHIYINLSPSLDRRGKTFRAASATFTGSTGGSCERSIWFLS